MPKSAIPRVGRLNRTHKLSAAGVAVAGAAALVFAAVPGADADQGAHRTAAQDVRPVAFATVGSVAEAQQATIAKQADASAEKGKAEAAAKAKTAADKERTQQTAASRSALRNTVSATATAVQPAAKTYTANLDGWIKEALDIMGRHGIPGSYDGIHRNIMRESTGNPQAVNGWDVNAQNGTPSKGLLQVIQPTFQAYHVDGTSWDIFDPVANITAACKYAAAVYGSMDNVNSAY
ncbi:lytic transglycosylase [Streptomyces kasugaensis]|uniref:Lytic transglycosylase n=1 Tax=Streptomyces kasugaensis TaxID=1946 RepID=A0A4Q9HVN3_STRKA|nr:transglycosylase SLT domain-containing protein [Streptomyces kasugaensis]TBO58559.1 lytic transglycosylase [Streptomyces kasugaensis]